MNAMDGNRELTPWDRKKVRDRTDDSVMTGLSKQSEIAHPSERRTKRDHAVGLNEV